MGQMMLVIGAFSMLSILTLSINTTFLTALATGLEAQAQLNALSFGQALMDEIQTRDFDERVTGGQRAFQNSDFTLSNSFGYDGGGEAVSGGFNSATQAVTGWDSSYASKVKFDDVDDYHNYRRAVRDSVLGWFLVTSQVSYAKEPYPDSSISARSHYKVIRVTVSHPNLPKREIRDSTGAYHSVLIPVEVRDLAIYRRYF